MANIHRGLLYFYLPETKRVLRFHGVKTVLSVVECLFTYSTPASARGLRNLIIWETLRSLANKRFQNYAKRRLRYDRASLKKCS